MVESKEKIVNQMIGCSARVVLRMLCMLLIVVFGVVEAAYADKVDTLVTRGKSGIKSGIDSQKRIDAIADKIENIDRKHSQESKAVESLKVYNNRMQRTVSAQQAAMDKLRRSIEDASLIERQVVPLMLQMIDGLEQFVQADLPFKQEERRARIQRIKSYLTNANISASERFRQVLDAYSIESDYGDSIDVYTETVEMDSKKLAVNILQVGRAALYFQTLDGQQSAYWDRKQQSWVSLDGSHNAGITHAIRMTQGKESKDLMTLPVEAPETM